jgi:hypothetical protein
MRRLHDDETGTDMLGRSLCTSTGLLENVDASCMQAFIDDQRNLKREVYSIFKDHPALLVPTVEQLSKSEHRQLVRDTLHAILAAGFNPLHYFDADIKRYIYMAEICAPVDLSLVRSQLHHNSMRQACCPGVEPSQHSVLWAGAWPRWAHQYLTSGPISCVRIHRSADINGASLPL